jgi:hypothetical protein
MIGAMPNELRTSFARIGRSYPRPIAELPVVERRRIPPHVRVAGAVLVFLAALGFVGWLLAR